MSVSAMKYACASCRISWKSRTTCPRCSQPATCMGTRWRAPKRRDLRAWRAVAAGGLLWDKRVWTRSPTHCKRFRSPYDEPRTRLVRGRHVRWLVRLKNGVVSK